MRNSLTVMCAAAALALTANFVSAQVKPKASPKASPKAAAKNAYEAISDAAVVKDLRELGMKELLEAYAKESAGATDLPKLTAAINATLAEASFVPDPEARDKVLDRAVGLMDKALSMAKDAAEKEGASGRVRMEFLRLRLLRSVTQGVTRAEPYAQQVLYLLESETDRKKILDCTGEARKSVSGMAKEIAEAPSHITDDDRITGIPRMLDALSAEARYNEAWMLLYEGIATPADPAGIKVRATLLPQAITLVSEWLAPATGGKKKVTISPRIQQESLLISGIASRELKEASKAKGYLEQLLVEGVPAAKQAQALFEIAHAVVDEGKLGPALAAIKDFQDKALAGKMLKEVGIDMQAALLTSHLYDHLAVSDAPKAQEYTSKSAQVLVDFVKKHPEYTQAFIKLIKRKFQGKDVAALPPELRMMLAKEEKEPDKVVKMLEEILNSPDKKTPAVTVEALMGLGQHYRGLGRLGPAAASYRRVAQEFPKESAAQEAALAAVLCLHAGVNETSTFKPGSAEFQEYTQCLEVLLNGWGGEKDNRDYSYFLGLQYDRTSQFDKAVQEFEKIPKTSDVYAPARFRSLTLRGMGVVESPATDNTRQPKALAFVKDAGAFHQFVLDYKAEDKTKVSDVRAFGPEIDLVAAQVLLEILNDYAGARKAALRLVEDWPEASEQTRGRCKVLAILSFLKENKVKDAMDLIKDVTSLSEDIVSEIVRQIRARVDRLDPIAQKADREEMVKQYAMFVEDIYRRALERFKTQAATRPKPEAWLETQMFEYTKGLAGAMEESSDIKVVGQALQYYQKLIIIRKDDAVVVRGLARCSRKIGDSTAAMRFYNNLVNGLTDRTPAWWQANAERMEYAVDVFAKNAEQLEKIIIILGTLADNDAGMGGPALKAKFAKVEAQAKLALTTAERPVETKPAPTTAPAPVAVPASAPAK